MKKMNDPVERRRILRLNTVLICIFIILPLGSFFFVGLDFAKATLIGCSVVAINFFVSQFLMAKIILENEAPFQLLIWYFIKFALSIGILYVAVLQWKVEMVGLMIGLSSVFVSTMISSLLRGEPAQADE